MKKKNAPKRRPSSRPLPKPQEAFQAQESESPMVYGDHRLILLARDPWWVFAYWEVSRERLRLTREAVMSRGLKSEGIFLRVYDVTCCADTHGRPYFDIGVGAASNWYVDVGKPSGDWIAELGLRAGDRQFFSMMRSNRVSTPRHGFSDELDVEWLAPEGFYDRFGKLDWVGSSSSSFS